MTAPHDRPARRSRAAHALLAERIRADPSVVVRAKERLARWMHDGRIHPEWADRWYRILSGPAHEIPAALVDPTHDDLRQTSPFAGEIDPRTRWRLWKETQ